MGRSNSTDGERAAAAKRDLSATRARICHEAKRIFSERGLEGARIDQIAAAAGVSKAMIYYLHPSKDDLYRAVLEGIMGDVAAVTRVELTRDEFRPEDFKQIIDLVFEVFRKNAAAARILIRELTNGGEHIRQIRREHPEHFQTLRLAIDRIYQYIRQGRMRDLPAERYLLALMALALFIVGSHPCAELFLGDLGETPQEIALDEWRPVVIDIFMRSMIDGDALPR